MDFGVYDGLVATIYELGSRATGHSRFPKTFFKQAGLPPLPDTKPIRVLEAGCGTLRWTLGLTEALQKQGKLNDVIIDAFDASERMLRTAEKKADKKGIWSKVQLWLADGQNLSRDARAFYGGQVNGMYKTFHKENYHIGITSGLLEVIPNWRSAIKDFNERIMPSGYIILSLVNNNPTGDLASKTLRFKIRKAKDVLPEFEGVEFQKIPVKTFTGYMEKLKTIYVGKKL